MYRMVYSPEQLKKIDFVYGLVPVVYDVIIRNHDSVVEENRTGFRIGVKPTSRKDIMVFYGNYKYYIDVSPYRICVRRIQVYLHRTDRKVDVEIFRNTF